MTDRVSDAVFTSAAQLAFMIGHPVAHTAMPSRLNALARKSGVDCMMVPIDLAPAGLAAFVASLREAGNVAGVVATAPHKAAMTTLVDRLTDRADHAGLVNLAWFEEGTLWGDNTDGAGFVSALDGNGFVPHGSRCLVFGAGGAGSAIVTELSASGAQIDICDISSERAEALAGRLGTTVSPVSAPHSLEAYALIVNATGVGLDGKSLVHDLRGVRPDALVADVVTSPEMTPWLQTAAQAGARIQTGREMAFAQIPLVICRFGWTLQLT